jgi:hypothetical protein
MFFWDPLKAGMAVTSTAMTKGGVRLVLLVILALVARIHENCLKAAPAETQPFTA